MTVRPTVPPPLPHPDHSLSGVAMLLLAAPAFLLYVPFVLLDAPGVLAVPATLVGMGVSYALAVAGVVTLIGDRPFGGWDIAAWSLGTFFIGLLLTIVVSLLTGGEDNIVLIVPLVYAPSMLVGGLIARRRRDPAHPRQSSSSR